MTDPWDDPSYSFRRDFPNGTTAAIVPLTLGRARIIVGEGWSIFDGW